MKPIPHNDINFQVKIPEMLDPQALKALFQAASQYLSDMTAVEDQNGERLKEIGPPAEKALSKALKDHKRDLKLLHNDLDCAVAKLQHVSRPAAVVEGEISLL